MPSRRALLAAGGAALIAGCNALASIDRQSDIDCAPGAVDWPTFGYDAARTGNAGTRELPDDDAEPRQFSQTGASPSGGGSAGAGPAVDDGVAYVAGDVRVEAREIATGERLWTFEDLDGAVDGSPALGCDAVYVSAANETVALDAESGDVEWRSDTALGITSGAHATPVVVDDALYVAEGPTVLDAETGETRWSAERDGSINGFAVGDRVYVANANSDRGTLRAVTESGRTWWETAVGPVYNTPVVADGTVYVVSRGGTSAESDGGEGSTPTATPAAPADPPRLTAVDAADGTVEWERPVEQGVYEPPAVADGRVFVAAGNGEYASAFDAETGDLLWEFETGVSQAAPLAVGGRVLLAGSNRGIYAVDVETGEAGRFWDLGHIASQPVVVDGRLFYARGTDSEVYVLG